MSCETANTYHELITMPLDDMGVVYDLMKSMGVDFMLNGSFAGDISKTPLIEKINAEQGRRLSDTPGFADVDFLVNAGDCDRINGQLVEGLNLIPGVQAQWVTQGGMTHGKTDATFERFDRVESQRYGSLELQVNGRKYSVDFYAGYGRRIGDGEMHVFMDLDPENDPDGVRFSELEWKGRVWRVVDPKELILKDMERALGLLVSLEKGRASESRRLTEDEIDNVPRQVDEKLWRAGILWYLLVEAGCLSTYVLDDQIREVFGPHGHHLSELDELYDKNMMHKSNT